MLLRNKILLVVALTSIVILSIGIGVGYYLMAQNTFLSEAFDNNPFLALDAAGKLLVNQLTPTPTKTFNIDDAERAYNRTVTYPEDYTELSTAEEIIEWSVAHQHQPWIQNISELLTASGVSVDDVTLHLVFIDTASGDNPVMTITYWPSNNTQRIEKGWTSGVIYNSYTGVVTEAFALEMLQIADDGNAVVRAIIQNYNGAILITKDGGPLQVW